MAHTAQRFRAITAEHGPGAVSAYIGNPTAFNALATLHVGPLLRALGVRRTFSSGTQDCANKFVASEAVFGTSTVHPIPDLEHTDLCIIIGENPRASQASFYSIPNVLGELRRATARGARIVFVNPRRIETPERGIGDTVQIRPDTDVWFLAALLHEIDATRRLRRRGSSPATARVVDELRDVPRRVPGRSRHRRHRHRRRRDPRARRSVGRHAAGVGPRLDRASTWVVRARSPTGSCTCCRSSPAASTWRAATSRATGSMRTRSPAPASRSRAYVDTEFGRLRRGALPGTLMADAILDSDDAGAGDDRRRRQPAAVDRRPGAAAQGVRAARAAGRHRHLPERDGRARPRRAAVHRHVRARRPQRRQHRHERRARSSSTRRPSSRRLHDRKPEWWIAHRLLQELGETSILDDASPDPWSKWRHMLQRGAGVELAELQATGEPAVLPAAAARRVLREAGVDGGRSRRLLPAVVRRSDRAVSRPVRRGARPTAIGCVLIHGRDPWMHNTWFANLPRMKRGGRTSQPAVHQPCRRRRRSASPTAIGCWSRATTARSKPIVAIDDELMSGVVSMVHGWGHRLSPQHADRRRAPRREPERAAPERSRQLRAAQQPGAHDRHPGHRPLRLIPPRPSTDQTGSVSARRPAPSRRGARPPRSRRR